eukprot:scaffold18391_cov83-Cylindrotheca_fusiformis.AAC.2
MPRQPSAGLILQDFWFWFGHQRQKLCNTSPINPVESISFFFSLIMSGSSSRERPRVATFSFSDSLLGDTTLDPPSGDPLTSPAGASLASYSTAQSGGGLKGFVLIKAGDKSFCLGLVGNDKVCVKTAAECSVSKHQSQKQTIIEDTFFVQEGPNRILSDLSIPASQVTKAAGIRLLEAKMTIQEWEEFMNEFRVLSQDQFPVETFQLNALLEKTASSDHGAQGTTQGDDKEETKPPSATSGNSSTFSFEEVEPFEKSSSTDVSDRLELVEEHLSSTGNSITKELSEVVERVNQTQTSLTEVVKSLGTSKETGQLTGPNDTSIWDTLLDVREDVKLQKQEQTRLKHEVDVEIPADFSLLAASEEGNWKALAAQLQSVRAQDAAVIKSLEARIQALETNSGAPTLPAPTYTTGRRQRATAPTPSISITPLMPTGTPTGNIPSSTQAHTPPATASTGPTQAMSTTLSDLVTAVEDLQAAMIQIRSKITSIEARLTQDTQETERIKFGGLGFENLDDAEVFVIEQKKNGSEQVGFLIDVYLLCNMVFRHVGGDHDFLKTSETINKLDLKSNRAAQALVAFQAPIPELFNDPTKSDDVWTQTAKDRSYFSRFKTYADWTAAKTMIREKLGRVCTGTREQLVAKFPNSNRVRALYEHSLSESALCLGNLMEFIDQTVYDMTAFGMSTARAYALGTRLGDAFFRECHKVRASVADDLEAKNPRQVATALWFAVSKTLDVMISFKGSFKEHPAISSEYIQFIVQNTVRDQSEMGLVSRLDTFDSKLKELEKSKTTATDAKKTAESAKKLADANSSKIANAAKDAKEALKAHDSLKSKLSDKGVL